MTDDSIRKDLQDKLMNTVLSSGEANPEETLDFLFKAAMDVLRRAYPAEQENSTSATPGEDKYSRNKPALSQKGFEVLTGQFAECSKEASGYALETFVHAGFHGIQKADGGLASRESEALLKKLVGSGVDPIWAARSLVNSATKFALIQKLDKQLMTHILLSGITTMTGPSVMLDVSSIIEKMAQERGISKDEALKEFYAMMEAIGG